MKYGPLARLAAPVLARGPLGRLRLRTRFVVLLSATVLVFGSVNLVILDRLASHVIGREIEQRAFTSARRLADEIARPLLQDDVRTLRQSIGTTRAADPGLGYVMIVSPARAVLASTFGRSIPVGLIAANRADGSRERSLVISDRGTEYRDVAVPIMDGTLGEVRLGARLDPVHAALQQVRAALLAMVALFLVVGLFGAVAAADLISAPVEQLASAARSFDPSVPSPAFVLETPVRGEIGELADSYRAMAARLQQLHADGELTQERMVKAERLATVGALAAGIAHEVNNPLAGIRTCLQAIAREPEDTEQTRTYAEMMIEAAHAIEKTVRSLRDVATRPPLMCTNVDLRVLTERIALLLRQSARERGVELSIAHPDRPVSLVSDAGVLHQVLVNLVINAIDASPPGAAVELRVEATDRDVSLIVRDHGAGIAPEIRERIFDPFVTTKAHRGGTGLGLAMVRRLVSELDGTIAFAPAPGGGTAFTVTLPHVPQHPAEPSLERSERS